MQLLAQKKWVIDLPISMSKPIGHLHVLFFTFSQTVNIKNDGSTK